MFEVAWRHAACKQRGEETPIAGAGDVRDRELVETDDARVGRNLVGHELSGFDVAMALRPCRGHEAMQRCRRLSANGRAP
jgi:hypothetical protein